MKIQQKVGTHEVAFSSLYCGDTFRSTESNSNIIWMKTEYIEVDEDDGYNAVDISDGTMAGFEDYEKVIPVTVTAVVED